MARVESVSVATCRVPLKNVTAFATRTVSARDYVLVKRRRSFSMTRSYAAAFQNGGASPPPHRATT